MKIIFKIIPIIFLGFSAFAQGYKIEEGFYSGLDPIKLDKNKANIDNSVSVKDKPVDGKYYGYKFSGGGFFLAPEAFRQVNQDNLKVKNPKDSEGLAVHGDINYNVKANIGYEFDSGISGFVTYNVGDFSYNSLQKSATVNPNKNSEIGVGSQVNFSDDFKLKVTYTQQQTNNSASINGGRIKDDIIRFGTSYSF